MFRYQVIKTKETKDTKFSGDYQILEISKDYPEGETCGVYRTKKEALVAWAKLEGLGDGSDENN